MISVRIHIYIIYIFIFNNNRSAAECHCNIALSCIIIIKLISTSNDADGKYRDCCSSGTCCNPLKDPLLGNAVVEEVVLHVRRTCDGGGSGNRCRSPGEMPHRRRLVRAHFQHA